MRYIYGSGSGISSVEMDSYIFVARRMTCGMDYIPSTINDILISNRTFLSKNVMDMRQKINYCIVIIYYTGKDSKKNHQWVCNQTVYIL